MNRAQKKASLTFFGWCLVLCCAMWLGVSQSIQADARRLLAEGVTTQGVVTRKAYVPGSPSVRAGLSRPAHYFVHVRFTDQQGREQTQAADRHVGPREYNLIRVGDTVRITYRPGEPRFIYLRGSLDHLSRPSWWRWVAAFGILGGIGMIVAASRLRFKPKFRSS